MHPGPTGSDRRRRRPLGGISSDRFIFQKIERDGIPYAPLSTDREFLRRVKLDLTGRIPSPAEIRAFLADTDPAKRDKLIDRLVDSEAWG